MFASVAPTSDERSQARPGDGIVPHAEVVMDRAFTVPGRPAVVWPWIVQLGKRRAGWYFPLAIERVVPRSRRALRTVEPAWQQLQVGDVIPDYGGREATFEVAQLEAPSTLVYRSRRRGTDVSWSIVLRDAGDGSTRALLRLRLAPVRHPRVAGSLGGLFDLLTVAGLAAGLRERLAPQD